MMYWVCQRCLNEFEGEVPLDQKTGLSLCDTCIEAVRPKGVLFQ